MKRSTDGRPELTKGYARHSMELSAQEEEDLINLRDLYNSQTGASQEASFFISAVDMANMTVHELTYLTDARYTRGADFYSLDVSAPFTSRDFNDLYPGAVDEAYLREKYTLYSLLSDTYSDKIPTQQGDQEVVFELRSGTDVEDLVASKTISQGVTMQLIFEGQTVNGEETKNHPIQSEFVE